MNRHRSFARKVVLDGIRAAADDKGVMKERVMLAIIEREPDPREKAELLAIMRKDGHLPAEGLAA